MASDSDSESPPRRTYVPLHSCAPTPAPAAKKVKVNQENVAQARELSIKACTTPEEFVNQIVYDGVPPEVVQGFSGAWRRWRRHTACAAAAVAVADGARTLSSGEREGRWSLSSGEREGRWRASRKSICRTQSITHVTVILRIASFYTRGSQRIPVGWGRRMRGVQEEVAQVSCLCRRQDVSRVRVRNDLVQCDVDTVRYNLFNFGVNKFISGVTMYNLGVKVQPGCEPSNTC